MNREVIREISPEVCGTTTRARADDHGEDDDVDDDRPTLTPSHISIQHQSDVLVCRHF